MKASHASSSFSPTPHQLYAFFCKKYYQVNGQWSAANLYQFLN
jgi:hypothetical protein